MKRLILPLLLAIAGLGGGVTAGLALRPAPPKEANDQPLPLPTARDFVRLNNQFIVPVIKKGDISALVVLSLSIEVPQGKTDGIYAREPKLRDAFLQVLFDHSNAGGFDGAFTEGAAMAALRTALRETAQRALGPEVLDVLVTDIVRQDS